MAFQCYERILLIHRQSFVEINYFFSNTFKKSQQSRTEYSIEEFQMSSIDCLNIFREIMLDFSLTFLFYFFLLSSCEDFGIRFECVLSLWPLPETPQVLLNRTLCVGILI